MKINWGTGIVLAFAGFIAFILYFVVQASSNPRAEHDMVTESYYQEELAYQQEMDASSNLAGSGGTLQIERTSAGLQIRYPENMDPGEIRGAVSLYRPSNEQLDFELPIQISDSLQLIPADRLLDGRWDIRIAWTFRGREYLYRTRLTY
ncbi:FixH family protein [Robiginitalea sp. SC105]|uniref:FixH family protein n=1 Tax=Robiginitalea sp. SC105 TaxID=2762332 RepID=UPI00163952DD|nr:FixH family protein [Robiginitalea sp. SC105]MBC2838653.1 FixH family protein [Robiginitalea sp. SC105]